MPRLLLHLGDDSGELAYQKSMPAGALVGRHEAAVVTENIEDIRQAMRDVERLANQLTQVMLNPQADDDEPNERL